MLKRSQVLLTDWLFEHIKLIAEKHNLSFSEMIRIILCEGIMHSTPILHPELKGKINIKLLSKISKEGYSKKSSLQRKQQLTSQLYFETRKILERINAKLKNERKSKKNNSNKH